MGKQTLTRSFVEDLKKPCSSMDGALQDYCALDYDKACCKGKGFQLTTKGPLTSAEVCSCVKACPSCLGHAHKIRNNQAIPCKQPSTIKVVNMISQAGIPARYVDAELRKFSNKLPENRPHLIRINQWIKKFDRRPTEGLLLSGSVGIGNTYLLACIAKELAFKGYSVRFVDFFQLLAQIRAAYSDRKSDFSVLAPLIDVDVLIIDELGKGRNSDFELTILDQLVMGRYNQNKCLVASTNCELKPRQQVYVPQTNASQKIPSYSYQGQGARSFLPATQSNFKDLDSPSEAEGFGSLESRVGKRIFSRLMETTEIICLSGDDFRKQKIVPKPS